MHYSTIQKAKFDVDLSFIPNFLTFQIHINLILYVKSIYDNLQPQMKMLSLFLKSKADKISLLKGVQVK